MSGRSSDNTGVPTTVGVVGHSGSEKLSVRRVGSGAPLWGPGFVMHFCTEAGSTDSVWGHMAVLVVGPENRQKLQPILGLAMAAGPKPVFSSVWEL